MKKTLALLVASTALTAAIGLPAWSAMRSPAGADDRPITALFEVGQEALPVILASDDDDDEDDDNDDVGHRRSGVDDDDDDEDEDEDEDEDDRGRSGARNPAPAGTVAPPQNGLFGNGAPPQVKVN